MAQLIVRRLDPDVVAELRKRAARSGRSMEAEHREILRAVLRPGRGAKSLKELLLQMPAADLDTSMVEDAYGLTPEERALLRSTRPVRDPLDVLEAKIRGGAEDPTEGTEA